MIEKTSTGDKFDLLAHWVGELFQGRIDAIDKWKLCQLLLPYMRMRVLNRGDVSKHRALCLVLLNCIQHRKHNREYWFIEWIHEETFAYLIRMITESKDAYIKLYVFLCLEDFEMDEGEQKKLSETLKENGLNPNEKLTEYQSTNIIGFKKNLKDILRYQLNFVFNRLYHKLYPSPNSSLTHSPVGATLNLADASPLAKLSLDCLSVRSDWRWQGVRSECAVSDGIFYYEMMLLTNGPVVVGWATKRTELPSTKIGDDQFSIGFDGYSCRMLHQKKNNKVLQQNQYWSLSESKRRRVENVELPQWQAGDVVGCLLDASGGVNAYHFYLNGHEVYHSASIYHSPHPYHAVVSLAPHQQVLFNFGQQPFLYRISVRGVNFATFNQKLNSFNDVLNCQVNLKGAQITNSLIAIGGTHTFGTVVLPDQPIPKNPIVHYAFREMAGIALISSYLS